MLNDGKFSSAMISANTQIVIMDEWTSDSLTCEEAKRVLQGELIVILIDLALWFSFCTFKKNYH